MDELRKERDEIDEIDRELARLFERRMAAAARIGEYKRAHSLPVLNTGRENEVVAKGVGYIGNPVIIPYYTLLIRYIMELSRNYQSSLINGISVGYSGVEGAFAQIASRRIFRDGRLMPYGDFAQAYQATVAGECECCVLPVENSTAGDVGQVMDLMFSGPLYVNGIYNLPIKQCLIGIPGTGIDDIKTVISHPQALSQCASYIKEHGYETVKTVNTAVAAKQVADNGDRTCAAIASIETAELYGLAVIDHDINEAEMNTTRFAVLSLTPNTDGQDENGKGESIIFFTVRNEAGALAKAVNIIGTYGFNMKSLRSRPMRELAWQYYFYVEFDGNVNTEQGKKMLGELSGYCDRLKVAGTFREEQI